MSPGCIGQDDRGCYSRASRFQRTQGFQSHTRCSAALPETLAGFWRGGAIGARSEGLDKDDVKVMRRARASGKRSSWVPGLARSTHLRPACHVAVPERAIRLRPVFREAVLEKASLLQEEFSKGAES